jgi:hypothetical protein
MNDIVKFKGAALPAKGLGANLRSAIMRAKDTVGVVGNTPFLRLTKGTGEWVYGAQNTDVEDNSLWAVNPSSFMVGFIAWKGGRPVGKKMRPISATPVTIDELPDVGADWDVNVGFSLQCVYGEDKDTVVEYTANSYGGKKAYNDLLTALFKQAEVDELNIVAIVELKSDFYIHPEWGKTYNPIFEVKKWVGYDGDQAGSPEASPPTNGAGTKEQDQEAPPKAATNGAATPRRRAAPVTDVEDQTAKQPEKAASPEKPAEPVQRRRRRAAAPA